jgi:TRAP-type C4-dicarboxylate transport system permease small subunit
LSDNADIQTPGLALGEAPPRVSDRIEGYLAAAGMAALCLITFANVVVRYLTDVSFAFTEEYSVAIMVVVALFGSAAAFAGDRHIRMTFFVEKLALETRRRIELVVYAICLVMFAAIAWYGARLTWDEYRFEVLSPGLGVPQWLYTVALPALSALICLRILGRFVRVARSLGT